MRLREVGQWWRGKARCLFTAPQLEMRSYRFLLAARVPCLLSHMATEGAFTKTV